MISAFSSDFETNSSIVKWRIEVTWAKEEIEVEMKDESVTSAGGGGQRRDVSESTRISPNHVRDKVPEYEN